MQLDLLLLIAWFPLFVMAGYICTLCWAAYFRPARDTYSTPAVLTPEKVVIIVAAHNEEETLPHSLSSLLAEPLVRRDLVYVVANHCTDDTATIARRFNVRVIEHTIPGRVSRGYGLAYALQIILQTTTPEIVVMLDGDSWLEHGAIGTIVAETRRTNRPTQAAFFHLAPEQTSPSQQLSEFAVFIRNYMRPLGLHNLGLPDMLFAGLMAFPTETLTLDMLADDAINEDMHLALRLAQLSKAPVFCPKARVYSLLYRDEQRARKQRERWEIGHLGLIRKYCLPLGWQAVRTSNLQLGVLVLNLAVPPLSLVIMIMAVLSLVSLLLFFVQAVSIGVILMGLSTWCLLFVGIRLAWLRYERKQPIFPLILGLIPYMVRKVPAYLSTFLRARWRFERDD